MGGKKILKSDSNNVVPLCLNRYSFGVDSGILLYLEGFLELYLYCVIILGVKWPLYENSVIECLGGKPPVSGNA